MEEAVGTGRNSFVSIDPSRADYADGRLVCLHVVSLIIGGVRAKDDVLGHVVGACLNEESVLHVACGMVGGKVQHGEHVQVVVYLRSFGQREAHTLEDVDNLVLRDAQRMACTQLDGVGCAGEVDVLSLVVTTLQLFLQCVDVVEGLLFQFVNLNADSLLVLGCHVTEVLHQCVDFAFAAEVFQSQLFNFLGIVGREGADFFQQCFNSL